MRVVREEITREPSKTGPGELIKHYQCSYCKSTRATAFNISTKEVDDYKTAPATPKMKKTNNVDLIRIEIHTPLSGKKFYEFRNLEQSIKFLEEYDSDK
jgi:hypothetical protein